MKRSPILQPLSREHHTALTMAKACERAALSGDAGLISLSCQRAVQAFSHELEPHFQVEERSLLPLLQSLETQPLVQRTLADHNNLRGLIDGLQHNDVDALSRFGKLLADHVRFEERTLFPAIEDIVNLKH